MVKSLWVIEAIGKGFPNYWDSRIWTYQSHLESFDGIH